VGAAAVAVDHRRKEQPRHHRRAGDPGHLEKRVEPGQPALGEPGDDAPGEADEADEGQHPQRHGAQDGPLNALVRKLLKSLEQVLNHGRDPVVRSAFGARPARPETAPAAVSAGGGLLSGARFCRFWGDSLPSNNNEEV